MRRHLAAMAFAAVCVPVASGAQANETVAHKQTAGSLSGVVHYGGGESILSDVKVAECDQNFRNCVDVAETDASGRFAFTSSKKGATHYLRFLKLNWCEQEETVHLRKGAPPIEVDLHIGT